eukprot:5371196-Prymnesium_polylepis.2
MSISEPLCVSRWPVTSARGRALGGWSTRSCESSKRNEPTSLLLIELAVASLFNDDRSGATSSVSLAAAAAQLSLELAMPGPQGRRPRTGAEERPPEKARPNTKKHIGVT